MNNYSKVLAKGLRQSINEDRMVYYGIAILLVVLYHLYCQTQLAIVAPFKYGVIGVDIFLFFSGYGLCFSYEKNSLREFYKRRAKRILPIFWIHFFFTVIEHFSCGGGNMFTPIEFLANFLCVPPFYGIGGTFVDWFTAAILQFYLVFPILYYLMRKFHVVFYVLSILAVGLLMYHVDLTWQQSCFVGRIPIFLLGIAYYLYGHNKRMLAMMLAFSFLSALALFGIKMDYKQFFFFALVCPVVIYGVYLLIANRYSVANKIVVKVLNRIKNLGKCSLEIYYGNGNANIALRFCHTSCEIFCFYALLTIFYSYVLACVNKKLK